jgi:predicted amidohydrolase
MKVALWSLNLARKITSVDDWLSLLEEQLISVQQQQVDILVLPEYLSEHFLSIAQNDLLVAQEVPWMAAQSLRLLEPIQRLADHYNIAILAGTVPVAVEIDSCNTYVNRSHFFSPNKLVQYQDKLCLTPGEKEVGGWLLTAGNTVQLIEYKGIKIAILICLDIEMPALSVLLAPLDIDLILVPSMTSKEAGYNRVFGCAKARAIELQAAIAVVGPIGRAGEDESKRDQFSSAAAFYLPCEESLGHQGVLAQREVTKGDVLEPLDQELLIGELDLMHIRSLRHGAAEVWPGGWSAEHIKVLTPVA